MSLDHATCRLLIRDPLRNNGEPQITSISSIQEMPNELRQKWSESVVEELRFNKWELGDGSLSLVLDMDGTIEIMNDSGNSDPEIYSAHYHSLADVPRAIEARQQPEHLSRHTSTPVNALDNFHSPESLHFLTQASMTNTVAGFQAALGVLTYRCIRSATSLQILVDRYGPALRKLLHETTNWIRAHPYKSASVLGGLSLVTLALAAPAILGAAGFSTIGPVAGSIAAAWQASIGLVASGSVFAFLQSAAMGGAAMGFIWVIGAFGGLVVIGVGLASLKGAIGGFTENAKEAIGGFTWNAKEAIGGFTENAKEAIGGFTENGKAAMGGFMGNVARFFGKKED